jgi:hypothetical protein
VDTLAIGKHRRFADWEAAGSATSRGGIAAWPRYALSKGPTRATLQNDLGLEGPRAAAAVEICSRPKNTIVRITYA